METQKKIKQAAQFLISSLRNYQLYILNFADPINSLVEMTLKLKAWLEDQTILMFNLYYKAYNCTL